MDETSGLEDNGGIMVDYMLNNQRREHNNHNFVTSSGLCRAASLDKVCFSDIMQSADLGAKLSFDHNYTNTFCGEENVHSAINDPVYFLNIPLLINDTQRKEQPIADAKQIDGERQLEGDDGHLGISEDYTRRHPLQLEFFAKSNGNNNVNCLKRTESSATTQVKSKRKRPKTIKTGEEVESQRMAHIAVERNRRKQMNEQLRILRTLMPTSYVPRGDQASIVGGAIEFVRELEQLHGCLESQRRRRLIYGEGLGGKPTEDPPSLVLPSIQSSQPPFSPSLPIDVPASVDMFAGLGEETAAESKSCIADVEVKLLGYNALIKILSKRRPGQLITAIAALEDLQFTILHTTITSIEQTVLYTFTVQVGSERRFTAEDIASSMQQIFIFIHLNNS
ncbi:hypothetical protein Nepgr_009865 [Nepenthes gracilis]|uniref:BHLH domain-containing protein n=1 Tax=Nepenthes gracilis TaxID=150966 RepID=A0AAD3XKS6_NEPGR|nr:hypothetical protein Nepgr_009865 [Nepenthes gracilis]